MDNISTVIGIHGFYDVKRFWKDGGTIFKLNCITILFQYFSLSTEEDGINGSIKILWNTTVFLSRASDSQRKILVLGHFFGRELES